MIEQLLFSESSPLYQDLVVKNQWVDFISGRPSLSRDPSLFLIFSADPCVAQIPKNMAAASGGWGAVGFVILAYEIATIGTMVVLVISAYAGARTLQAPAWMARYGDAVAGALILTTGAAVAMLGI